MDIMQAIAPVVSNPATVWSVVGLLVFWAIASAFRLWKASRAARSELDATSSRLEDAEDSRAFATRYEVFSEDCASNRLLGPRWREYRDLLVLPTLPGRPVRATARPDGWFDASGLLRAAGADPRYHAALPNLLVGAGLLFTFLGLAAALGSAGGVVAEGVSQHDRNAALKALLDTASFKFITSLFGLGLSIAYALYYRRILRQTDASCSRFMALLEARVPLLTPASLQHEANALLDKQNDLLEAFSNELAINIGSAFDSAFDKRLGEHIAPLTDAMQRLAGGMASRNEDVMQQMLNAFLERLQGGAGDQMNQVADNLSTLGTRLEGLQSGLGDAAVRMAQSADAMATRMGEGAEAALQRITDQMGGLVENLRAVGEQTRSAGADAGHVLVTRIEAAAGGFEAAARAVVETLSAAAVGLEKRMGEEAVASSSRLAAQFEAMVTELRSLAETSRASGQVAFETLGNRIAAAAAGFEATAARVADALTSAASHTGNSLGRGAEDAVRRIAEATEDMRTQLGAMVSELRASATSAGESVRDGARLGAEELRSTVESAGANFVDALESAAATLRQAGDAAGGSLREAGSHAGQRLSDGAEVLRARADAFASQLRGLGEAGERLGRQIAELDSVTRDSAQPLAAGAADMRAASAATQQSLQSLLQVSDTVRVAVEQLSGVAQRIQDSQAATGRLVDGINQATGRFEGLDRALAGTLTGLQTGLQGFTKQVHLFVIETDKNLAQAATQLGSLTKNLEETLGDFLDQMKKR